MDERLLREFLAEAEDLIEGLFEDLRGLRRRGLEGRARRELVGRAFRRVHTIKGSASSSGLDEVARLAHEFETLLEGARAGRVRLSDEVLEAFEAAVEGMAASLSAAARGLAFETPAALVERLRRLSEGVGGPASVAGHAAEEALPGDVAEPFGEAERARLREAVAEGARTFVVTADFDLATFDESFRALSETLSEGGEIVSTLPGVPQGGRAGVNFRMVYATRETPEEILRRIAPFGATLLAAGSESSDAEAAQPDAPALSSLTMRVRVPLEELDELISAAHEIFDDSLTTIERALEGIPAGEARREVGGQAQDLRRRFFALEERLIGLRMVPVRQTLERAARVGAASARAAGREVEFRTSGGEVRLDKSLAEAVSDPLLHLLRNAVDHGIEPPDERRAAGKPARGCVRLEAAAEGGLVVLRVSDDGRGVEAVRVARAAAERGIIGPDESLTEQQALRLIFRPGFSTARTLSEVSGRGVGLDVVERAVEASGGELRVRSRAGAGTTFELRLPTTLALLPALVVAAGGERFCVAAAHVYETVRVHTSELAGEEGARRVKWGGEELPLFTLASLVGTSDGGVVTGEGEVDVLISRAAGRRASVRDDGEAAGRVGVAVDAVAGRGEVLGRSLGRHATRWLGVSGATELRDGTVALLLDLPRLLETRM